MVFGQLQPDVLIHMLARSEPAQPASNLLDMHAACAVSAEIPQCSGWWAAPPALWPRSQSWLPSSLFGWCNQPHPSNARYANSHDTWPRCLKPVSHLSLQASPTRCVRPAVCRCGVLTAGQVCLSSDGPRAFGDGSGSAVARQTVVDAQDSLALGD